LRKAIVSMLILLFLFCGRGFVFAGNSAMFLITATMPPSAQAGKEIVFEARITNTGTETWVSGEYSVLVKIYDANKNYLTETDKIRQFKDTAPGEALTTSITFDIPENKSYL